jgi:hypothetical protein
MRIPVSAFVLGVLGTPLAAAPAVVPPPPVATPAKPDPARIAAADRLLAAMHYDSLLQRSLDQLIADGRKSMPGQLTEMVNDSLPPELIGKVQDITEAHIRKTFAEHGAEMKHGAALIYASHFTVAELDHLVQLQSDPVMVKMQSELPKIAAESVALSRAAFIKDMPALIADLKTLVETYKATGKVETPAT